MKARMRYAAAWALMAACAGCASNGGGGASTSPARGSADKERVSTDAIRAAAALIEKQVYEGNREPVLEGVEGIVIDTPEIRQAARTRAARVDLVRTFLDSGNAWERPNGRLWIIRSDDYKKSTTSRRRDLDAIMVNSENNDRWTIYEGILDANRLPQGGLNDVQQIFFEVRKAHMTSGQKYEGPDGEPAAIP